MVNYKPNLTTIAIAGFTKSIGSNQGVLLKGLVAHTVGKTLHNYEDDTDYVVPAGKTLHIIGMVYSTLSAAPTITIYQSDDADAETNTVSKFVWFTDAGSVKKEMPFLAEPTVAAGKYLNWKVTSTTNAGSIYQLLCYET